LPGQEAPIATDRWIRPELSRPGHPRRGRRQRPLLAPRRADRSVSQSPVTPDLQESSDELLVVRLREGDVAAGEALVARYYLPLTRYLQRVAGPRAAEDLHQQTWVSVLAHVDRFVTAPNSSSFRGWLFRIASNKTKDHWRSARREKAAKEAVSRIAEIESPWAGSRADGAEQQDKLRRAIEQLPQAQRDVLMMRYYGNFKFVEIADILGCPVNTALTRAHKGLIRLREAMGHEPAAAS
jgi:RNA polymerase sigma-70 factor, ECF subfamily